MIPSCNDQREELILAASESRELTASQRDHVARCVACRALMARVAASVEALGDLPRLEAPADLEGRVVASLNAGFREDRSVRHLSALEKLAAPHELEHSLQAADELEADLFARVEQELLRPEDSVGQRLARVVDRLEVPAELEQRVANELTGARSGRPFPLRLVGGFVAAAAALAFVWSNAGSAPEAPTLSFTVRQVQSAKDLNPMARSVMGGLTGGATEVREF